jgi:uridylate kinase
MVEKDVTSRKRVLLKLSGEVFGNPEAGLCIDPSAYLDFAERLKMAHDTGTEIAVVIGGGNIFRGLTGEGLGTDRVIGDTMGMLATMINSLALSAACRNIGLPACVMSSTHMPKTSEMYVRDRADKHLRSGRIVIIGGGTGNPFFTTDSAAALRAAELGADVLLKATKVDGIYSTDPMKDENAKLYKTITYDEALRQRLKIMDSAAFSLCRENGIPIIVFNFFKTEELNRALKGEPAGTLVRTEYN